MPNGTRTAFLWYLRAITAFLLLSALLAGCAGGPAAVAPTSVPASATAVSVENSPALLVTPTFESVANEPTVAAIPATAQPAEVLLSFTDAGSTPLSAVSLDLSGLPAAPDGRTYAVWLYSETGVYQLLDAAEGGRAFNYIDPQGRNLAALTQGALLSLEAIANVQSRALLAPSEPILAGQLGSAEQTADLRLLLASDASTPNRGPLLRNLAEQADLAAAHARLAQEGLLTGNLPIAKLHVEHTQNIVSGAASADFGDLDGNGQAENPGDGFGVAQYATRIAEIGNRLGLASADPGLSAAADQLTLCSRNISNTFVPALRDQGARGVLGAADAAAAEPAILQLVASSAAIVEGSDANRDGVIAGAGECGVRQLLDAAAGLFSIRLNSAGVANLPAAVAATVVEVSIGDNLYTPAELSVPVGATVIWRHVGQRPHTVTANNGAFNSGRLQNGGEFRQTFTQTGEFAYFCEVHGQGMAGLLRVGEAAVPVAATAVPVAATAAPVVQATVAPPPPSSAPVAVRVDMGDNTFAPAEIRIPVGGSVTWVHIGQRPHTVTADDNSYNSGRLQNGGTFTQSYTQPGVYPYYCEIHGGPGGAGMAAQVIVGDQ